jgi:rhodanese-related sulfurtransferase
VTALARSLALVVALAAPAAAGHPWASALLTIDPASLQRLAEAGSPVALIDVRPVEAYRRGHLPGARSIPLDVLARRRIEIPADAVVVLYGVDSVDEAAAASRYLRAGGHARVLVLEGGFVAWQTHGLRVER